MQLLETMDAVANQEWLDPPSDGVQRVVSDALRPRGPFGSRLDDLLNGTWLGHPLHPVLTDIPVGAWTVGLLLDGVETLAGKRELAAGADAANWIGIAGALGSAVTGLAQWQYTVDRQRRLGMAHALLNTGALALYGVSALLRAGGRRRAGKIAALMGYAVVGVSAYIGGDLVFAERVGVYHVPEETLPDEFTAALPDAKLAEGQMVRVEVGGVPVLLARQNGSIFALSDVCAHLGAPLHEGTLNADCSVTCPWHGSRFALADGHPLNGPTTFPLPRYETRVRDGQIEVRAPR